MNDRWATAAGLGAVTGLRSMTGLAAVSRELAGRRRPFFGHASELEEWLADDLVSNVLSALAIGELVADKLPGVPDRVSPGPLFGRGLIGGVVGAIAAGPDDRAVGAALGVAGAVIGSYLGWFLRREAGRATMIPDGAFALGEDAIAVGAARELAAEL